MKGPTAIAGCPHCAGTLPVPYARLGSTVRCDHCSRYVVAAIPPGGVYPVTGADLHYGDFLQLISDPEYRSAVQPLVSRWFGYTLAGAGADVAVLNDAGEALDPLWLHLRIQEDAARQSELYQTAMSLWR